MAFNGLVLFSGTKEEWPLWSIKFRVRAELIGYGEIIDGTMQPPIDSLILTRQKYIESRRLNRHGYYELMCSMSDVRCINIIEGTKTTDFPKGHLKPAWEALEDHFVITDVNEKLRLQEEFIDTKLKIVGDVEVWGENLVRVKNRLEAHHNSVITDDDLIMRALNNIPNEGYKDIKISFMRQLSLTVDPLTFESLIDQLRSYNRMTSDYTQEVDGVYSSKQVKGQCGTCGKHGHSKKDCYQNKTCELCGNKYHTKEYFWKEITCGICKRQGNPTSVCWDDPGNSRPFDGVTCDYRGKTGHDEGKCFAKFLKKERVVKQEDKELVFVANANGMKNSNDMVQWIADSGSSHHITREYGKLTNIREGDGSEVVVGNGKVVKIVAFGDFEGYVTGTDTLISIKDVGYRPSFSVNLFSITKALEKGYDLSNKGKKYYR